MGNKFRMKKISQILLCAGYFLLGLWAYIIFDGGTGATTQGVVFSIAFAALLIWFGVIFLSVIAVFVLWLKKSDWYIPIAVAICAVFLGVLIGILQDVLFMTPAEYGERGWAWAAGKYGAWRALK